MHLEKEHERDMKCQICKEPLTLNESKCHLCGTQKMVKCEYCRKKFDVTINLLEHLETVHTTNKRMIRCEKCSKFYPMEYLKECHQATHDKTNPISFDFPPKQNPNKILLHSHLRTHKNQSK